MQKILLVVNTKAGKGDGAKQKIEEIFRQAGVQTVVAECKDADAYREIIKQNVNVFDALVVGGGDGTVKCAAEGLIGSKIPLGIIPLGTANNVARSLGLPLELEAACATVLRNKIAPMDLARVNDQIFVSVIGIGLSTKVHEVASTEHKKKWGVFSYLIHAMSSLKKIGRGFRVKVESGSESLSVRAAQITVCNGKYYGAHLDVATDATLQDGELHLSLVEAKKYFIAFLNYLTPWDQDRHSTGLKLLKGKRFEIHTTPPMKVDVEGGSSNLMTPIKLEVLPAAIQTIVP